MSQSLTCSVVTDEDSFDAVQRNDICFSALKAALNLEEEVWWCLAWFLVQDLLPGYMVKLTQLYTKRYWKKRVVPNLRTAINQPAVNTPYHTAKSVKTFLSEKDVTVLEWPAESQDINPI